MKQPDEPLEILRELQRTLREQDRARLLETAWRTLPGQWSVHKRLSVMRYLTTAVESLDAEGVAHLGSGNAVEELMRHAAHGYDDFIAKRRKGAG